MNVSGICVCEGIFRGDDCSIDPSIAPTILDNEGPQTCQRGCLNVFISGNGFIGGAICHFTRIEVCISFNYFILFKLQKNVNKTFSVWYTLECT